MTTAPRERGDGIRKTAAGTYATEIRDANGKKVRKTFAKRAEAKAWRVEQLAAMQRGTYIDRKTGAETFGSFAERWAAVQPWALSTRNGVKSRMANHITPTFGERPLAAITQFEVQAWVTELDRAGKLAPGTVRELLTVLRLVLRAAVRERVIPASPGDGVRLPRKVGKLYVPFTTEQVQALADTIDPRLREAVIFAALTGLRQGELLGLTLDRIDFLGRSARIDRQAATYNDGGAARFANLKTATSVRDVPLCDEALDAINRQLAAFGTGADGLVFHRAGVMWRRDNAGTPMRVAASKLGLDGRFHGLRHYTASVLIREGASVTAVAAMLGHSPAECLKTYAAWWPNEHEVLRSAIGRAWSTEGGSADTKNPAHILPTLRVVEGA